MAEIGNVNLALVTRKHPGNNQIIGSSDQRKKAYISSARSGVMETGKERRIGSKLAANTRVEPIGVVGAAMRRTKRHTSIDAPRAAELLDIDPSNEPPKTVTNEVQAATPDVPPQVSTQRQRCVFDPGAGTVVERKYLLDASKTKVRSDRE